MARVKRGIVSRRKHNKLASLTKGYRGTKSRLIKAAKEAQLHAGAYAYHGRKVKKRDIRALWITRISEASKKEGISYSRLMDQFRKANIEVDRKILSDLVLNDPEVFSELIKVSKPN
ncbi:MAG TPA: 50S ribosomal protein L20 [Patescibacteria group bacterium]|jgi:large subunit ribosomal protein L20|nr:50S ribosomal protein L20 [Patescibacteria group bacterium]